MKSFCLFRHQRCELKASSSRGNPSLTAERVAGQVTGDPEQGCTTTSAPATLQGMSVTGTGPAPTGLVVSAFRSHAASTHHPLHTSSLYQQSTLLAQPAVPQLGPQPAGPEFQPAARSVTISLTRASAISPCTGPGRSPAPTNPVCGAPVDAAAFITAYYSRASGAPTVPTPALHTSDSSSGCEACDGESSRPRSGPPSCPGRRASAMPTLLLWLHPWDTIGLCWRTYHDTLLDTAN